MFQRERCQDLLASLFPLQNCRLVIKMNVKFIYFHSDLAERNEAVSTGDNLPLHPWTLWQAGWQEGGRKGHVTVGSHLVNM